MSRYGFTAEDGTDWIVGYDEVTGSMFGWCTDVRPVEFDVHRDGHQEWWSVEWDAGLGSFEVTRYAAGGSPHMQWCRTPDDVAAAAGGPLNDDVRRGLAAAQAAPADVGAGARLATVADLERALGGRAALPPEVRDRLDADRTLAEARTGFRLAGMQAASTASRSTTPAMARATPPAALANNGLDRG
ncbi:MAG: hypothetical protein BGO26_00290 [Actinobacteria bacterium 69-20]|nr:MAG: hypothetical protein BGO26_00290 [Actinobacteria bacterium 69-20]